MHRLLAFALIGLVAQLVDGTLGMAYGVTCSTLLLMTGAAPALASASIHLAEIGTTLFSGVSHWQFGNVDWRSVRWLAFPGGVGAFAGALTLGSIPAAAAKPWVSLLLLLLGGFILIRFAFGTTKKAGLPRRRHLVPLGLVAGFLDAVGGGGWGPISTPTLIATGRMDSRRAIGSVSASEFVVALSASLGFLISVGRSQIDLRLVAALLVAGAIAAPLAAYFVRKVSVKALGSLIGGAILLTNARGILNSLGGAGSQRLSVYAMIGLASVLALVSGSIRNKRPQPESTTS